MSAKPLKTIENVELELALDDTFKPPGPVRNAALEAPMEPPGLGLELLTTWILISYSLISKAISSPSRLRSNCPYCGAWFWSCCFVITVGFPSM